MNSPKKKPAKKATVQPQKLRDLPAKKDAKGGGGTPVAPHGPAGPGG
jgi:hypothetical protein